MSKLKRDFKKGILDFYLKFSQTFEDKFSNM